MRMSVAAEGKRDLPANRIECPSQQFEFVDVERLNTPLEIARYEEEP
jgi:hypothetical protein